MKPSVGAIHELPLPMVLAITHLLSHTCIQQRQIFNRHGFLLDLLMVYIVVSQVLPFIKEPEI